MQKRGAQPAPCDEGDKTRAVPIEACPEFHRLEPGWLLVCLIRFTSFLFGGGILHACIEQWRCCRPTIVFRNAQPYGSARSCLRVRVLADEYVEGVSTGQSGFFEDLSGAEANDCFEMMFPVDGYEVKADELDDFVTTIRVNCPGVSPALYLEWSEGLSGQPGTAEQEDSNGATRVASAASSTSNLRIPVEIPADGGEPEESMEISVFLKRGSKMWQWTVVRQDGSQVAAA